MGKTNRVQQCAQAIIWEHEDEGKKITQQEAEKLARKRLKIIREEAKYWD
jgi:hypothetical protein